ncbi:MAG: alpha/beta fold hydrolase [Acidihalobacter sp.]
MSDNPELGRTIMANGIRTNYHDLGEGPAVLLIHGSGPGVTAFANWRLTMPELAQRFRVIAPDMVGFGETERALALALAIRAPQRVGRLVLMGSVGVPFEITEGLDAVWGYEPSIDNMRALLDVFAYDRSLVNDELARLRYEASVRPGYQEAFSSMFPAPRQRWVDAMVSRDGDIRALAHDTLIVHGREDRVIPLQNAYDLLARIPRAQLHVFGECGHWTQIEHAARFNRLLLEHFGEA